jgi:hypothetical protein
MLMEMEMSVVEVEGAIEAIEAIEAIDVTEVSPCT